MSSDEIAISVHNLTKTYRIFGHPGDRLKQAMTLGLRRYHREFTAIEDVSFDIKKGETVGIIGRNGSGKSTLLQLISGVLKPTSGSVKVNGCVSALLELGAGFNQEFTGRENVLFQGALMGLSQCEIEDRFDDIAAFADIGEFIDQPVKTYSSGMFVRLAFSVAAHVAPAVLLVDEALSVGDMAFQRKCTRKMESLCQAGVTILLVSHDLHLIERFCDRALVIDHGACVCNEAAAEATMYYRDMMKQVADPTGPDSMENRLATGEIELIDVQLLDVTGSGRDVFATGEDVTVVARYFARAPIKRVFFGCSVWANEETRVAWAGTVAARPDPFQEELSGQFEVRMLIPNVPLLPGNYFMRGGVYDERLHYAHCLWGWTGEPLGRLKISTSKRNDFVLKEDLGFFLLDARWQVFRAPNV